MVDKFFFDKDNEQIAKVIRINGKGEVKSVPVDPVPVNGTAKSLVERQLEGTLTLSKMHDDGLHWEKRRYGCPKCKLDEVTGLPPNPQQISAKLRDIIVELDELLDTVGELHEVDGPLTRKLSNLISQLEDQADNLNKL